MKPTLFLRIASVLTLIHAILHTIGGVFGKPVPGTAAMVAATMQSNRFAVFGVTRSYADFYFGLGMGVTIFLSVSTVLLWQLSNLARTQAQTLRPILATLTLGFIGMAVNSQLYFFAGPVIVEVLIGICLGAAISTAKPGEAFLPAPVASQP
ncbi:MAG: hypothetical protein JO356_20535 [Acidobacteria bacterium]|nr:hypothetical protein [Acidobacteriota bacterium]